MERKQEHYEEEKVFVISRGDYYVVGVGAVGTGTRAGYAKNNQEEVLLFYNLHNPNYSIV